MGCTCSVDIIQVVNTIVLGLGPNAFDVFTDVGNGLYHYQPKNVTRYLGNSTVVPDNCVPHHLDLNLTLDLDSNATGMFECLEEDTLWALITFGCIQLPAVVLAACAAFGALVWGCRTSFGFLQLKIILGSFLILLLPFPILVSIQQVASLFISADEMELMSDVFLFAEGSLEASPQLLLLIYVILSDSERKVALIQRVSIVSSIILISKTSIKLFLDESYAHGMIQQDTDLGSNYDSITKKRSLCQKLKFTAQFSPAFLTSLIFKVGSIAIICTFLKEYSAIYLGAGVGITFIVAFWSFTDSEHYDENTSSGIFYSLTNVTILAKCPLGSRKENYPQMLAVSITWMILHTFTLIGLMIWFGAVDSLTHLAHWSDHRFTFHENLDLFYAVTSAVLVFGPISILSLYGLKRQVKALGEKEDKMTIFWGKL